MSALPVEPVPSDDYGWDDLVRIWEETDVPEGCKVEIIKGQLVVTPPPANFHNSIASRLQRMLLTVIPEDWGVFQTLGVAVPSHSGLFVPDLAVAPESVVDVPGNFIMAGETELIAEITSKSNAEQDRVVKPAGYAQAGVPLYLLIDRWAPGGPTITLFGESNDGVYRTLQATKFGEKIHLPAPFDLTIDTSVFPGA
ncbi:Uma2 family endonuclease [Streptomyces silvisoli]|uniref:Uma2 family endonuclease n=1 Tax=Streptomyces silvisoli TaxID=3034235 RepID=A0ABT5ZNK3_9ACTN|nr:Uma2 family endonuclease [Streptomyces silvisoli]MDF3291160.1 Uma2 family endonuclease [Streptomyces silvisoli]